MQDLLDSAKKKMYAARLERPTPYVDKTVYVGWNSMCVSAYLEAAKVLGLDPRGTSLCARWTGFWLRLGGAAEAGESARSTQSQLLHVVAYSDPNGRTSGGCWSAG